MNYKKIYNDLINSRKKLVRSKKDNYYESHHILPKCLGGSDDKDNLVLLTPREHYIAHWLLTKIHPTNYKIWFALGLMTGMLSPKANRQFSSRYYAKAKEAYREAARIRINTREHSPGKTKKSRDKARNRMLTNNPIKKNDINHPKIKPIKTINLHTGSIKYFLSGVLARKYFNIPKSTWKWCLRNTGGLMKKYNIKVEYITKEEYTLACQG